MTIPRRRLLQIAASAGVLAAAPPKGTPPEIVERLHKEINVVRFAGLKAERSPQPPDAAHAKTYMIGSGAQLRE